MRLLIVVREEESVVVVVEIGDGDAERGRRRVVGMGIGAIAAGARALLAGELRSADTVCDSMCCREWVVSLQRMQLMRRAVFVDLFCLSPTARLGWLGSTRGIRADRRPELETDDADVSCGFGGVFLLFVNCRNISVQYRRQELNRIEV